jgi:hypothetical protein
MVGARAGEVGRLGAADGRNNPVGLAVEGDRPGTVMRLVGAPPQARMRPGPAIQTRLDDWTAKSHLPLRRSRPWPPLLPNPVAGQADSS